MSEKVCPICNGTGKTTLKKHNYLREQYLIWFNAGKVEQARVDREAVEKLTRKIGAFTEFEVDHDMLIAALSAVAPEEMEYIAPCSKCGQPHIAPTADCHYDNRRAKEDEHDAE